MQKQEIGKFYATTFNNTVFEFIVYNDNTMDCPKLGIESFNRIALKPRFVLSGENLFYTYDAVSAKKNSINPELIKKYDIDEELFTKLKQNGMIIYSTDMAYLYNFNDKNGYDKRSYGVGSPYKWAKKKGPILVKQKKGQFN